MTSSLNEGHAIGSGWNFILKDRVGGVSEPGIRVGGNAYFTTAIGIHASMSVTFNLDELRRVNGDAAVGCFSTFWGMDDCLSGEVELIAVLSNDAGVLDPRSHTFTAGQGEFLSIEISRGARYLTLMTGSWGGDACDHGTFARPIITPSCPVASDGWIWGISPSRVAPGERVNIDGEALFDDYSVRIGGVKLGDQVLVSDTRRFGVTPALAAGVDLPDAFRRAARPRDSRDDPRREPKTERIVPFGCKAKALCPSCSKKRALLWAERMAEEVLPAVPYLQLVFTIPKIFRSNAPAASRRPRTTGRWPDSPAEPDWQASSNTRTS